jgi:hypothetical protein
MNVYIVPIILLFGMVAVLAWIVARLEDRIKELEGAKL